MVQGWQSGLPLEHLFQVTPQVVFLGDLLRPPQPTKGNMKTTTMKKKNM